MTFQFKCPSGCLLEGEPTQAGSTIQCPICSQWFVIPAPVAQQPAPPQPMYPEQPVAQQPAPPQPTYPEQPVAQQPAPGQPTYPQQPVAQQPLPHQPAPQQPVAQQPVAQQPATQLSPQSPTAAQPGSEQPGQPVSPQSDSAASFTNSPAASVLGEGYRTLHFHCPGGHVVEAPRELAGQQATCPHCAQQFLLLETESDEYKQKIEIARRRREAKIGNAWLNWAIIVGVLVFLGIAFLLIKSQLD